MSSSLTPRLFISSGCILERKRELPIEGEILVKKGDLVNPNSVIGVTKLEGEVALLRIKDQLGISINKFVSGLLVKEGDSVLEQDIIFNQRGPFGLFSSAFKSPYSGVVEFISESSGTIGIRLPPKEFKLKAYIAGEVLNVEQKKSATIEGRGGLIQGIFGVGGEQIGKLIALDVGIDQRVSVEHLPLQCDGCILVGGICPSSEVLLKASERGAVGFVTGSIEDASLKGFLGYDVGIAMTGSEPITMSVMITEGFGELNLHGHIMEIARLYNGSEASINGTTQIRAGALRPELLIFPEDSKLNMEPIEKDKGFYEGARIRGTREPYFGKTGTIKKLPVEVELLETGIEARVAVVKFDNGVEASVPRANLEML